MKSEHNGSIEDDFVLDGYSTPICSCGWSGEPAIDPQLAMDELREHYKAVKEAAK